ncbi:MAG TPA: hypothetical protein VMS96_09910 [Terriglobales bacterium]|nr:hypothetical protein [Terriglobales bacterium]
MLLSPINAEAATHASGRLLAGVGLVSLASLLLELSLTRLFSVVLFYHFAFLAISIALLGLGAGGVFAFVARDRLSRWSTRSLGSVLCALNSVLVVLVLEIVLHVPVALDLSKANFLRLTVLYIAAAVPFFLTGLLFSVVFARQTALVTRLYGADLCGGAASCLLVVPLLTWIGGPNAILFAALMMAVAALVWSDTQRARRVGVALTVILGLLIAANYRGRLIDIVYAKGQRRDRPWMLWARWNAISRVEVDQVGESKYIVIDADASTAIMNVDPRRWAETQATAQGADHVGGRDRDEDPNDSGEGYNWKKDLMSAAPAIANVLRPHGDFAIIGPGGGVDVLRAVANGSPSVTAIEINPLIATDVMRGHYADYSYHLYELPQVHLHVADGRSWIRASHDKYDVIQMTLVDTWASTAAGAFALSENNLYTLEAFREYFDHLKPDGFIAITRWEFAKPREALRVVAQAMAALHRLGVADPGQHFVIVSDGRLDTDGRPVAVLVKKSPFTADEIAAIREHLEAAPELRPLYVPESPTSILPDDAPATVEFSKLILQNDPSAFAGQYSYNVAPVGDNAPFFFFTFKTGQALESVLKGSGAGMDWKNNLGIVVLGMLLVIATVAVLSFLILPLALYSRARRAGFFPLLYFVAIGLGYILVEITLIQRFVLFLGHPTYALTVVVFLMLLSSGAGSVLSRRWLARPKNVRTVVALIVAGILSYLYLLPRLLTALVGQDFGLKLLLSALLIVPLGLAMGMPFPTGLRALAGSTAGRPTPAALDGSSIEWAWAMNAASSVLGSVLAMVVAIHFGLAATLIGGAVAYLLAGLFTASWSAARSY